MKTIDADFLVIGSGMAGLMSALHLSRHGQVLLTTKRSLADSNTDWAQGGIACAVDSADSVDEHIRDTLATGGGLSKPEVVRAILSHGPDRIADLESRGVHFARQSGDPDLYDLGQEAGHSRRRVLHAGDITGHEVIASLEERVRENPAIEILENTMAIDLITTGWMGHPGPSRCIGAYFLPRDPGGQVFAVRAPYTVLATGGLGKVYLYTTNPDTATGDGLAMAWRAGLPVRNMEFVQFHPTCLYHQEVRSFLISEAVRGEGARLIDAAGRAFMRDYDERGELAPRDIVARAIDHHMKERGDTCVYIDIRHRSRDFLERRFPNIYAACLKYGFDLAREPVPVVPAAHYACGGIDAGIDGHTELPGLFACGEVACTGLHGANRLASNSLLEALVCAHRTAEAVVEVQSAGGTDLPELPAWRSDDAAPSDEAVVIEHNWHELRTCMWDYVGIVRTDKRLERARRRVETLREEIRQYYLAYTITPDALELRNITAVASLIIRSAAARRESRGLHYTRDCPEAVDPAQDTILRDAPGGIP